MKEKENTDLELVTKHLDNISKELEHRGKALEYSNQQDERQFQYHSRQSERDHELAKNKLGIVKTIVISAILLVFVLTVFSLYLIQSENAFGIEILEATGFLITGMLAGFGLGKIVFSQS